MTLSQRDIRKKFKEFWESKGHKEVTPAPLVLTNDPTTLFNSSGMQQLIPYLLGENHEQGKLLYNIQPSFRAVDIEEVGDNRHTTFFEMMGNWSLGEYFKEQQLPWFWEFLMSIGFEDRKDRIHATVFEGDKKMGVPKDEESYTIWKKVGLDDKHIHYYGVEKNWWSRSGTPEQMPAGEIGGPDSEVFYDFGAELKLHENSVFKDEKCHPNCDCGRFMEIGNSVFIQYRKKDDGTLEELTQKNVDFGGGLERILAAVNDNPDVFKTDLYTPIIHIIESHTDKQYDNELHKSEIRIVCDHFKASVIMIEDGLRPSNKEHGYILRRLLRRAAVKTHQLGGQIESNDLYQSLTEAILKMYQLPIEKTEEIAGVINDEMLRFKKSLENGLKEIQKIDESKVDGKFAFDLYQNLGFPFELTEELLSGKDHKLNRGQFKAEFEKHKNASRSASTGKFKGGLADNSDQVLKYHTATHLIHQALFDVLGNDIRQEGSNITGERLRFDFYSSTKPSEVEIKKVEDIVNQKIKEELPVDFKIMPKEEAAQVGAKSFFKEKYPDMVKVYYIGGDEPAAAYSKEFCGGPHVQNTKEISSIKIYRLEKIGSDLFRIYAK